MTDPTDLTTLLSLDPLQLSKQDLDQIIAYQRKQRVQREGGARTKKATGEAPAIDIKALLNKKPEPSVPVKPVAPKGGFIRRF